jgi:hypothetical protein
MVNFRRAKTPTFQPGRVVLFGWLCGLVRGAARRLL